MANGIDRPDSALLVIDLQCGMFDGQRLAPIHEGARLLEQARIAIDQARRCGARVLFVRHGDGAGELLEEGTPGWQIHPALERGADETIIDKRTPDSFLDTPLAAELAEAGVSRLAILGAQTEFCVDTTCRQARSLGYEVALVADAHSTWDNATLAAEQIIRHTNETLASGFAKLITAGDAGAWLMRASPK